MRTIAPFLALLLPLTSNAQDTGGFNAHGFNLVPQDGDLRDMFTMYRPGGMRQWDAFGSGLFEYANTPLVYVTEIEGEDPVRTVALNHLAVLHLTGGFAVHDRIRFGLAAPVYFTSTGFDGGQGPSFGDLRLDTMIVAVEPVPDGLGFGVAGWLDLPTGSPRRFLGRRTVAGGFSALGTLEVKRFTLSASTGLQLEPKVEVENFTGPDLFMMGGGLSYLVSDRTSVGAEALLRSALSRNERAGTGSPAEAIVSLRHRHPKGAHVMGGFALPLSPGVGAAAWRVFVGGGFGKLGPLEDRDRDGDGIPDRIDQCPDDPETFNDYLDEDGCPDQLPTLDIITQFRGQPVGGVDLVIDGPNDHREATSTTDPLRIDVFPDTMWAIDAKHGACLVGSVKKLAETGENVAIVDMQLVPSAKLRVRVTDEKGKPIPGATIAWNSESPECVPEPPALNDLGRAVAELGPGKHAVVAGAPGYRIVEVPVEIASGDDQEIEIMLKTTKLRVETKRIVILETVQFEFDKDIIKPESFELLNEVAETILRNPQAGRVQVQGHTDDRGRPAYNLDLSQRRADAVMRYLIGRKVPEERLVAKGFGMTQPIATNDTNAGRAINRRVEFVLIDQAEQSIEEPGESSEVPATE
jgi:outer membrane protein OmpA-like peptidoglycan-associated protein